MIALGIAALLSLGYAAWAFTARRSIFADFADGKTVSSSDAKSSDNMDTIFLIVAGVVALLALAFWVFRWVSGKSDRSGLGIGGLVVS
ncbi:MAG: hypothetical protein ACRDQA_24055, partial [Nocardioidaceae bacterium]